MVVLVLGHNLLIKSSNETQHVGKCFKTLLGLDMKSKNVRLYLDMVEEAKWQREVVIMKGKVYQMVVTKTSGSSCIRNNTGYVVHLIGSKNNCPERELQQNALCVMMDISSKHNIRLEEQPYIHQQLRQIAQRITTKHRGVIRLQENSLFLMSDPTKKLQLKNALTCAAEIVETSNQFLSDTVGEKHRLRCGVDIGDVYITKRGDIYGQPVMYAKELEATCIPKSLLHISKNVDAHLFGTEWDVWAVSTYLRNFGVVRTFAVNILHRKK